MPIPVRCAISQITLCICPPPYLRVQPPQLTLFNNNVQHRARDAHSIDCLHTGKCSPTNGLVRVQPPQLTQRHGQPTHTGMNANTMGGCSPIQHSLQQQRACTNTYASLLRVTTATDSHNSKTHLTGDECSHTGKCITLYSALCDATFPHTHADPKVLLAGA